jgi:hypothetical protein
MTFVEWRTLVAIIAVFLGLSTEMPKITDGESSYLGSETKEYRIQSELSVWVERGLKGLRCE